MNIRRNISMPEEDFIKIKDFAQKERISFSELLRKATKMYIKTQENMNLSEYLQAHCEFVTEEEQKDLEKWIIELKNNTDYDSNEGQEINLDDIIQGKL